MNYSTLGIHEEVLPLRIHSNYLLRVDLMLRIILIVLFTWGISSNLVVEEDSLNELYRKMALGTFVFGLFWSFIGHGKIFLGLVKNKLFITLNKDQIAYEYITEKGEKKTHTLFYTQIEKVSWSFFPYSVMTDEIWITDIKERDKKHWAWLFSFLYVGITLIMQCLYIILNFKIERYILLRFNDGIMAIPVRNGVSITNISFEWNSLINRLILNGGYYGK